jgi:hypothetical protein
MASTFFVISSTLTILSHCQVLGTVAGILLIILRFITCKELHQYEKIGAIATTVGALIMVSDKNASKSDGRRASLWGDFFALMCS